MTIPQPCRVAGGVAAAWILAFGAPQQALAQVATPVTPALELVPELAAPADGRMLSSPADLAARLEQLLQDPALLPAHTGLSVEVAETGQVLFRHHAAKRFVPASNTKIVSAAVALAELGADYTWTTRLLADGPIVDGTLNGNLWIVGGGDPHLTRDSLLAWPELLRQAGIERIQGAVIGDDLAFEDPQWGAGWMWDDLYASWGSGVSALQLSPNRVRGGVVAGAALGSPATLFQSTEGPVVPIINRVRTGAPGSEVRLRFMPPPEGGTVELVGWVPLSPDTTRLSIATPHPTMYLLDFVGEMLRLEGITVDSGWRRAEPDEEPAQVFWSHDVISEPLSRVLDLVLKPSDNQMAETLLLTLGLEEGKAGTAEEGLEVVSDRLARWGIAPDAVELTDGSGMSRYNQVTPDALVRLLRAVWRRADFPVFYSALPVAGVDGTLQRRMIRTPAERNATAKTGSLSAVRALSGYLTAGDGSTLVFSLLINGYAAPGSVATAIEDLLVEQLSLYRRAVPPGWPGDLDAVEAQRGGLGE
ncbi:MAG: D-alanyl-D-alanine carboxypeptidase/D-alanyl-D-alanine-endopeptidase [Gemmatimonadota bacterium]